MRTLPPSHARARRLLVAVMAAAMLMGFAPAASAQLPPISIAINPSEPLTNIQDTQLPVTLPGLLP